MATSRPGLGYPSISKPNVPRDLSAVALAIDNTRQRIEAIETSIQTLQASTTDATVQQQIAALSKALANLTAIVNAFSTDAAVDTLPYVAGEALSVFQVVVPSSTGRVVLANPNDAARMFGVLGITITNAAAGGTVTVQSSGPVTVPGASFVDQQAVYATTSGGLTQSPVGDTALMVGVAIDSTTLFVIPSRPALLTVGGDSPYEDFMPITLSLAQSLVDSASGGDAVLYDNTGAAALTSSTGQAIVRA